MRYRIFIMTAVLCIAVFLLSLTGCKQVSDKLQQPTGPDVPGAVTSGNITASPSLPPSEAPSMKPTGAPTGTPSDVPSAAAVVETPVNAEKELQNTDAKLIQLALDIRYKLDLDGDSVSDTLLLRNNKPQWSCDVLFNGTKINDGDDWTWISQAQLIRHTGASPALIYQQDGDDGRCTMSIYTFTDGKAVKVVYRQNAYSRLTPDSLVLTAPVYYFLGNQAVSIEAVINKDFTLTLGNDGWFSVVPAFGSNLPKREYRAKVDIPMRRLENGSYVDATLPAGTRVYPQLINEAITRMIMKTDDGALWMYTRDKAGLHFEEGELFTGCTFAGP